MPTPTASATDFSQFASLRLGARAQSPEALKAAARQFESLMTQQLLKASHAGATGDDLLGGGESDTYRDLFDQQMAMQLSSGKGLGIADLLVQQLQSRLSASLTQPGAEGPSSTSAAAPSTAAGAPARVSVDTASADPDADADGFVNAILPHAERAAKALGVPTEVIVAQAALETGWGQHPIRKADGTASNNFFGIKADSRWGGARVSTQTTEVRDGVAGKESAAFRAYGSIGEGFDDYVKFVRDNPRYAAALRHGGDGEVYARGLQKAGYATDPAYAQKIGRIAYGRTLRTSLNSVAAGAATRLA